jgi:hypothetical protein
MSKSGSLIERSAGSPLQKLAGREIRLRRNSPKHPAKRQSEFVGGAGRLPANLMVRAST